MQTCNVSGSTTTGALWASPFSAQRVNWHVLHQTQSARKPLIEIDWSSTDRADPLDGVIGKDED